jgi:hypothetical protein
MTPETLRALLMDRELGELSPDIAALLDAYLAASPEARVESEATARTINTTRETVRRFPELAPRADAESEDKVVPIIFWLTRIAALAAVVAVSAWGGFWFGSANVRSNSPATTTQSTAHRYDGLWSRYQVARDSRRGTYVVTQQH